MAWRALLSTCLLAAFGAPRLGTAASASAAVPTTASQMACTGPTSTGVGGFRVPFTIRHDDGPQFVVEVCIEGEGPFPFIVDTGAEQSAITPVVAQKLKLPSAGKPEETEGLGCKATATPRTIGSWSIGGITLGSEVAGSQPIGGLGSAGEPVGLIGADVLSRFGAVRFDFVSSELVFPGPEGPAPTKTTEFQGPSKIPVPRVLVSGSPRVIPLAVAMGRGFTSAVAGVSFAKGDTGAFLIDTGASQSVVTPSFARDAKLHSTGKRETSVSSACGTATVVSVASGPWSIGSVSLSSEAILSSALPGGLDGIFGADQLSRFRFFVLAYRSGELLVGPKS
jgi:predicted aspartyl protease